jgi:hypothetical protein
MVYLNRFIICWKQSGLNLQTQGKIAAYLWWILNNYGTITLGVLPNIGNKSTFLNKKITTFIIPDFPDYEEPPNYHY